MRFRSYLKEDLKSQAKKGYYPDVHYKKPGNATWIYSPPNFYWWDPKKNVIKDGKKVIITFNEIVNQLGALTPLSFWFPDNAVTHEMLKLALLYIKKVKINGKNVRGRSLKGNHQTWHEPDNRAEEILKDKAIDAAYKYLP